MGARAEKKLRRKAGEIVAARGRWKLRHPGQELADPGSDRRYPVREKDLPLVMEVRRQLELQRERARAAQVSAELAAVSQPSPVRTRRVAQEGTLRERVVDRTKEFGGAMRELLEIDRQRRIAANPDGHKVSFVRKGLRKTKEYIKRKGASKLLLEIAGLFFMKGNQRIIAGIWYGFKTAARIGSDRFLQAAKIYADRAGVTEVISLRKNEVRLANFIAVLPFISKGDVRSVVEGVKYVNAALDLKAAARTS